jgi:hypothetical protein
VPSRSAGHEDKEVVCTNRDVGIRHKDIDRPDKDVGLLDKEILQPDRNVGLWINGKELIRLPGGGLFFGGGNSFCFPLSAVLTLIKIVVIQKERSSNGNLCLLWF